MSEADRVFLVYERRSDDTRRLLHAWKTKERADEQCAQLNSQGQSEYFVDEAKILRTRYRPRSFVL